MRIGIVTQPLIDNYGGILQNYALQQVLKTLGHTPVTLNYMPSLSLGRYILYAGKGVLFAPFPSKRHPIKPYRHYLERPAVIDSFIRNNISTTRTVSDYTKRLLKKYRIDALIVGSDQVWRYSYNSHYLEDMFLAFAKDYPCPKIAYGASFGVEKWDYPEMRAKKIRELVKQFDTVTVREDSGVILCRKELDIEAQVVLDPTLLLQASDYARFCSAPDPDEAPYMAAYVLDRSEEKTAFMNALAKSKNLKVKEMTVSDNGLSVEEWLTVINNAEFVFTDSYHGCLFSIIFGKQFQTAVNKRRGTDRFVTLFDRLNLSDHLSYDLESQPDKEALIDYPSVYQKLRVLRKNSLAIIDSALS